MTQATRERKIVWQDAEMDYCSGCGRAPYVRRDGRAYLYRYRANGPIVCSPRCDRKCDCEAPEPKEGVALRSMECPVHNENPQARQE